MPYKDPVKAKAYRKKHYKDNRDKYISEARRWELEHLEYCRVNKRNRSREQIIERKISILSHYGKDGRLQCCWPGCEIVDVDMLSIDHVNHDGHKDRKTVGTGDHLYRYLQKQNFPLSFQTLCHNHQWKKEIMRRRGG